MLETQAVRQPIKSTLSVMRDMFDAGQISHLDVAAAYATTGGVRDILRSIDADAAHNWAAIPKRWLIAFDYLRSEPLALRSLMDLDGSEVRIHDAGRVLRQLGTPSVPFHPKSFILRGPDRHAVLAGSGNISRSGLNTGVEAGLMVAVTTPYAPADSNALQTVKNIQDWFSDLWAEAAPLDDALLSSYATLYETNANRRRPSPTEDDVMPTSNKNALSGDNLTKLRVCRHFWIEAGNITRNLGKGQPGNQLMMRKFSRVFFGVPATDVPQNSPLTRMEIRYNGHPKPDCSLTFSDNGMDKLTLPIPGAEGPAKYDGMNLLFERVGPGVFALSLGSTSDKKSWVKASKAIDANFAMSGSHARQWGVF